MKQLPLQIPRFDASALPFAEVRSPYSGELLAEVQLADEAALDAALTAAHTTFHSETSQTPGYIRRERLERAAALLERQVESFAQGIADEGGKPLRDARVEAERAVRTLRLAAEEATRMSGETIPMDRAPGTEHRMAWTMREPLGVVVAISAFNHPLNLIAHQVGPALAMGNAVVVKPASQTPISCARLLDLLDEAGFSRASIIAVPCRGATAERLVRDSRTRFLSFIGSEEVGWHLRSILNPGARFSLEHGGEAAVIVDETADLDRVVPALVKGAFYHAGQVCISVQRIIAHRRVREELEQRLVEATSKLQVGDPRLETTDVGPLISVADQNRVDDWVRRAQEGGGRLLCGGRKLPHQCFQPTLVADPPLESELMTREVFGPVAALTSFETESEAIGFVNTSDNPFQSAVFAQDVDRAFRMARALNAHAVIVNDHSAFRVDWMPFGGRERAGFGMGGVRESCLELSRPKLVVVNLAPPAKE